MGMLDSLGNLGGLGQITKMLDAGNWVKQAVNSVLPKNMAVVGDAAGALFDLKTGNVLGAAQLAMDGLKDLPQATKSQQQQAQQQTASGTLRGAPVPDKPALEPSPPPATKPLDIGKLTELFNQILQMLGNKPPAPPPAPATTTVTTSQTTTPRASGWRGEPRTPAPAADTHATSTTPAPSATPTATPPAAGATAATGASAAQAASSPSAASADTGQTISSLAQLNSMSDSAIRDAVIHGRISPDVAKDQTAMMAIQQRMNAISEMNNLMTNMMRALHDMQMAVVQNIRI